MAEKVDYAALKKGGFMRQKQKGCFSLRIAVVGGNLTAENIKTVAEVAEKYGHGYVHMTSRQGIEIPFIKVEDINVVKEELAKLECNTTVMSKTASNQKSKEQRIFDRAPDIRERFIFLESGQRSKEYNQFMQNVFSFKIQGKNKHDDAPDVLAQAADMCCTVQGNNIRIMRRPF